VTSHMDYRMVGLCAEFHHSPVAPESEAFGRLFDALTKKGQTLYQHKDLDRSGYVRFHSTLGEGYRSEAVFASNRFSLVEVRPVLKLDDFDLRMVGVARAALDILGVPFVDKHVVDYRLLYFPRHREEGRTFVLDRLCAQKDALTPFFNRAVTSGIWQATFAGSPGEPGDFRVAVESALRRPREVTVDVKAQFTHRRLDATTAKRASQHLATVELFVAKRLMPFLEQFDVPLSGRSGPLAR